MKLPTRTSTEKWGFRRRRTANNGIQCTVFFQELVTVAISCTAVTAGDTSESKWNGIFHTLYNYRWQLQLLVVYSCPRRMLVQDN